MILFLTYQDGIGDISGSFTSIIDAYLNVSKHLDVNIKIMWDGHPGAGMARFKEQGYFGKKILLAYMTHNNCFEADTIVCSSKLLADIASYAKHFNIQIKYDRLILLDSLDIQRSVCGSIPDMNVSEKTILLANPANFSSKFKTFEYYHKLSKERMGSINPPNVYNFDRGDKKHIILPTGIYFENIGKRIWETIYKGGTVNYSNNNSNKDGLYYYLKLFGVDGLKSYRPLHITKEEVQEKLTMNENDLLLDILGG